MKKQGSEKAPGKWKTIRVRRESLDLLHAAIRDYSCLQRIFSRRTRGLTDGRMINARLTLLAGGA